MRTGENTYRRGRFYVQLNGAHELRDSHRDRRCLLVLGPPRGQVLIREICERLNGLGELGMQAIEVEGGEYAFEKLALKILHELTTVVTKED